MFNHILNIINSQDPLSDDQARLIGVMLDQNRDLVHTTQDNQTLLHHAAERDNVKITRILLDRGANANVEGSIGNTPLHLAAENDSLQVAPLLLDR
jgi:ankyrin repeat protein